MPDLNRFQDLFHGDPDGDGMFPARSGSDWISGISARLGMSRYPWPGGGPEESEDPGDGGGPLEGENPGDGGGPLEGEDPGNGGGPLEGEGPGDGGGPLEGEGPGDGGGPLEGEDPGDGGDPVEGESPGDGGDPWGGGIPVASTGPANSDEPVESLEVDPDDDHGTGINPMLWPWMGTTAALAAALIVALTVLALRGKKKTGVGVKKTPAPVEIFRTEQPVQPGAIPQVGKLHQQGARSSQQDCFSVSSFDFMPTFGLLAVVADGMGGLSDGDKVSQAAVAAMMNGFYSTRGRPEEVLLSLLGQANSEVNRLLGPDGCGSSGSTLVAGLVRDGKFYMLSVGDSRVCLYRNGTLYQLNREHIFLHELEQRAVNGEESLQAAYTHPKKAGLTSFLGMGKLKYVDIPAAPIDIQSGDKFLLMSDGVYNALTQAELTACLNTSAEEAAMLLGQAIRAKNYSNQDNFTAVILGF